MMMNTRLADLTVEEFLELLRPELRRIAREAVSEAQEQAASPQKRKPLNLPVIDVGPWPEGLSLRREDMYGDDGR